MNIHFSFKFKLVFYAKLYSPRSILG